uniref:Leucine-rich repeat and IQ domain-containing protein 1 isoform X3 n=1 Tax=Geotrypetes seraphini TaxID=260995 RepID=A0A6P8RQ74_GEOSA|nr:leucine-rich repeat and IQ domain-containing protein 1 isoform X3 [Geotrypetes seraphini]
MEGDLALEEEIELELSKVIVKGEDTESEEEGWSAAEAVPDELPESILCCLQFIKSRTEHVEKFIVQDLDDSETWLNNSYGKDSYRRTDSLDNLAAENNEDPEIFKKRQQQVSLEEELKKEQEGFEKELKEHEELIKRLQLTMQEERKVFEEQKKREKEILEEQQWKAAIKIQTKLRAFIVFRKYAPILKMRIEEMKKKREMKRKLESERKEMEEKIKRKLVENKQRAKEKKLKDEEVKKRGEEQERQECLKQEMRHKEYEKKKEEERVRLEREKQLKLNELKKLKEMERNLQEEYRNKFKKVSEKNNLEEEGKVDEEQKQMEEINDEDIQNEGKQLDRITQEILDIKNEEKIELPQASNEEEINVNTVKNEKMCSGSQATPKIYLQNITINSKINENVLKSSETSGNLGTDDQIPTKEDRIHNSCAIVDFQPNHLDILREKMQSVKQETIEDKSENVDLLLLSQTNAEFLINKDQEPINKSWENADDARQLSARQLAFPDHIETKRLAWMKNCNPWSKTFKEHQRKKVVNRSKPRKSSAASRMPQISAEIILQTGHWKALKQVTTVTLVDLPGCSLANLSECTRLQSLSLRRCGLTVLEGLGNCNELKYIDVQENNIQIVNCEDLENLCILLLGSNQLSSIRGLSGCYNLRNLQLSYNKITRIGGLESLKSLQQLVVDHNQLINTKGLEATPTLMYLDCSYNHLTEVEGIRNCGLLQTLKLQGNNLSKPPNLENQVLLRELHLDDNSVSSLEIFSSCWLPLLQVLSISQNRLIQLASLCAFVSLEKVDVSNNCLSDFKNAAMCLNGCWSLNELSLIGNPVLQEDWRCSLCELLPNLKILNGENLRSEEYSKARIQYTGPVDFLAFCQAQLKDLDLLLKRRDSELKKACSLVDASQIHCLYFAALMKLGHEHRYAHEYGDVSISDRDEAEARRDDLKPALTDSLQHNNLLITGANENKQDTSERRITVSPVQSAVVNSCVDPEEKEQPCTKDQASVKCNISHTRETENKITPRNWQKTKCAEANSARIAELCRLAESKPEKLHKAATMIQSAWRNHCLTRKQTPPAKKAKDPYFETLKCKEQAATLIQAVWKGFILRQKLASALAAVEKDEFEEELEEADLEDLKFDEAALDQDWLTLDSFSFPSKTLLLPNQLQRSKDPKQAPTSDVDTLSLPWNPRHAWQYSETAETGNTVSPDMAQSSSWSGKRTLSQLSDMKPISECSVRTEKEEQISIEWGFKDVSTAQLMLKRAQKMKSKTTKKRMLLDPAVRLALFKNNENKHPPLKPSKKKEPNKVEYFKGKEEEFSCFDNVKEEKLERSRELTYQWLHTQVGDYETSSSRVMKCKHFLPELNPEVLNGGRVQLVTSLIGREAMDVELLSLASSSASTQGKEKVEAQKNLAGCSHKDTPVPMKTNSKPLQKERISFRDNPVQFSGGWGGGKRRTKPFK